MSSSRKQFDEKLFEENDARARAAVAKALDSDGIWLRPNDDTYGPDLMVYAGYRHTHYIECEIKRVWAAGQETFPWPTIQVPERKLKFTRAGTRTPSGGLPRAQTWKPVEFWVLREDCGMAVIIPEEILTSSLLVEVPNSQIESGEKFFQVPLELCILRRI